jgi:hypothetical protein
LRAIIWMVIISGQDGRIGFFTGQKDVPAVGLENM